MSDNTKTSIVPWIASLAFTATFVGGWLAVNIAVTLVVFPAAILLDPDILTYMDDSDRLTEAFMTTEMLAISGALGQMLGLALILVLLALIPPVMRTRAALTEQLALSRPQVRNLLLATLGGLTIGHLPGFGIEVLTRLIEEQLGYETTRHLELLALSLGDTQSLAWPLMVITVVIGAPLFEELAFRGAMWDRVSRIKTHGTLLAWLSTSILFALYHTDPIHILGVIPIGLYLGLLRWRTGALWCCLVAHAANNGLAVLMTLVWGPEVSVPLSFAGIAFVVALATLVPLRRPSG